MLFTTVTGYMSTSQFAISERARSFGEHSSVQKCGCSAGGIYGRIIWTRVSGEYGIVVDNREHTTQSGICSQ